MGKIKNLKFRKLNRHEPLDKQISDSLYAKQSTRNKIKTKVSEDDEFVDDKLTSKILKQARQQQESLEETVGLSECNFKLLQLNDGSQNELDESLHLSSEDPKDIPEVAEEDKKALELFNCKDTEEKSQLNEALKEKLTEKLTEINTMYSDTGSVNFNVEKYAPLYKQVGVVLSKYRSGEIPKAFKVIPTFTYWEQILNLTQPEKWTAAAMYQATRLFASNLKEKMAQRFYNLYLLPRLRDDIAESRVLNTHLYQALAKAIFKPAAFFKGIILPLCESPECTHREATIFGSILAKCSIPIFHSCAALLSIANMEYSGSKSIIMRVLLEKKYALPFNVVNAVVAHFLRQEKVKEELPVLWHQCLLTFVQLYKNLLLTDQRDKLLHLLTVHPHTAISPEIRRELQSSQPRDYVGNEKAVEMEAN